MTKKKTLLKKFEICSGRVENIVGNRENAGYVHFHLFPAMFSKAVFVKVLKTWYKFILVYCRNSTFYLGAIEHLQVFEPSKMLSP